MDWASSEWKQGLSSIAIQKVNALEEKVEKLQKERQQMTMQNDCLKISLDKEKRKVDKEKQNLAETLRELQTLSETCKDIEDRHQKLQNEIQNRDSRIGSLEVLLAQYKNENCKLQQLVNDVKDLRPLREAALAKREQKALVNKESNESISSENEVYASLKEKIAEQEALIEELKKKVNGIPSNEILNQGDTSFKTPIKKIISTSVTDSPVFNNKNSASVWDGFGSTPARENKDTALRQNADSMGLDTRDEKLMSLQTRLKQLCQELECQRHNFEASKTAMEVKFKEKENMLKSDLNYQTQVNADLDKELKETKNRFQQELTQAGKKIDVLTMQLKKAEQAKEHLEKDFKSVESKISSSEMLLKAKEEELKDLQKVKNACDVAQQSLRTLKAKLPELERKTKSLEAENSSYAEKNKAIQMQLDGSNNLVQEKEMELVKLRKECQILTTGSKTSQDQVKMLNEKLLDLQNEFSTLQSQLKETLSNESFLKEQIQHIMKEKNELSSEVLAKTNALQTLQMQIDDQFLKSLSLEKDMENKSLELNKKLEEYENASKIQLNTLEEKLLSSQNEYSSLCSQYQDSLSSNSVLQEQINSLMMEKNDLGTQVETLTKAAHGLKSHIDVLHSKKLSLEEEMESKNKEHHKLSEKLADLEKSQEDQLKILYDEMLATQSEYTLLQTKVKNSESSEASFTIKIGLLENENNALSEQVTSLNTSIQRLQCEIEELNKNNNSLKMDMESKVKESTELAEKLVVTEKELKMECEEFSSELNDISKEKGLVVATLNEKVAIQELEEKLMATQSKCSNLQKDLANVTEQKLMLESRLELVEKKKSELNDNLVAEINKTRVLECSNQELKKSLASLDEELTVKSSTCNELTDQIQKSKVEYANKIHNLEEEISSINDELNELKDKLHLSESRELSLKEKLTDMEKEKNDLSIKLNAESDRCSNLNTCCEELEGKNCALKDDLAQETSRKLEIEQLLTASKDEYQIKYRDIEQLLLNLKKDYKALEARCLEYSLHEKHLKEKIAGLEKVEHQLRESLEKANDSTEITSSLKEELSSKSSQINQLESSKKEFEVTIKELLSSYLNVEMETSDLLKKVEECLLKESSVYERHCHTQKLNNGPSTNSIAEISKNCHSEPHLANTEHKIPLKADMYSVETKHELKIQQLENKLSVLQNDYSTLQEVHNECTTSALTLKEKLQSKEEVIAKMEEQLEEELLKSNSLDASIGKLTQAISELEKEVAEKSNQLNEANNQLDSLKSQFETKTQDIELLNLNNKALEDRFLEYSLNEEHLKEKISGLEKVEQQLRESLEKANQEIKQLELKSEELTKMTNSLKEDLSTKTSQMEELLDLLESSKEEFEAQMEDLRKQSSANSGDVLDKVDQFDCLQEKYNQLEKNNLNLLEKVESSNDAVDRLKICCEDLNKKISELEEEVSNKASEILELNQHIASLKAGSETLTKDLNTMLSASQEEVRSMRNQMQENASSETSLNSKLELLEEEKGHLVKSLETETIKSHGFETCVEELKEHVLVLEEEVSHKSSEIIDLNSHLASSMQEIKELTASLSASYAELSSLQNQLQQSIVMETTLKENLEVLEGEKKHVLDSLAFATEKIQILESENKELKSKISGLELELVSSSSEFINLNQQMGFVEEDLKTKIEMANPPLAEFSVLQKQLDDFNAIEKSLKEKINLLENDNETLSNNLISEVEKVQKSESCVQELKCKVEKLEEELLEKSSKITEINQCRESYVVTIKELLSSYLNVEMETSDLLKKVEDCLLKESSLYERHCHTQKLNNGPSTNSIAETSKNCHSETRVANKEHKIQLKSEISAVETKHEV